MQCEKCGTEMVWVNLPGTDREVVAGYLIEREAQDYRLMCPDVDCFEAVESEPDVIPF